MYCASERRLVVKFHWQPNPTPHKHGARRASRPQLVTLAGVSAMDKPATDNHTVFRNQTDGVLSSLAARPSGYDTLSVIS